MTVIDFDNMQREYGMCDYVPVDNKYWSKFWGQLSSCQRWRPYVVVVSHA